MEHIMISPGKLKLMLTRSDMQKYELDTVNGNGEEIVYRQALKKLFSDIRETTGFDGTEEGVFVQMYPSKDGGGELYITKLGNARHRENGSGQVVLTRVVAFGSMNELLTSCRQLSQNDPPENSSAWCGDGRYYLMWIERLEYREYLRSEKKHRLTSCVGGVLLKNSMAPTYLKEYCNCFCSEDAVSFLKDFA